MSSQQPQQATQHAGGETASNEIAELFRQAASMRSQPRLRGVTGICRFDIAGAGSWSVAVNDGEISVLEGTGNALRADCVVTCGAEDFLRILRRENQMNLLTAGMQGLLAISGDTVFAMAFLGSVIVAPVAAVPQR